MATRKTPTKKPAAKKPATKRSSSKSKPAATDKAVAAPVEAPEASQATTAPEEAPKAASVGDKPATAPSKVTPEAAVAQPKTDAVEPGDPSKSDQAATVSTEDTLGEPITRIYKGTTYELHPQADGTFKLGDQTFKSLTAAAQHVLGVKGGVSGPRFWGASGTGTGGSRLTPEERAVRDAERARKAEERAMKAKVKADEAARKAAAKAAEEAKRTEAAFNTMIGLLMAAAREGRLTTAQVKTLGKLPV